jgi:hypothetical protein
VAHVGEKYILVSVGKPEGKRARGRCKHRWEDNFKLDLQD